MQTICKTYCDAGKGNPTAQNTRKRFGGRRGAVPDPAGGAYSAPATVGGEGLTVPPQEPHPPLSAVRASPLLPFTPKLIPTPLFEMFRCFHRHVHGLDQFTVCVLLHVRTFVTCSLVKIRYYL